MLPKKYKIYGNLYSISRYAVGDFGSSIKRIHTYRLYVDGMYRIFGFENEYNRVIRFIINNAPEKV